MKTKSIVFLLVLLLAGSISAHAGGLIGMFTGGRDRGPQTGGKVTVKGLSRYEGKFVMGIADSDPALLAAGNITSGGVVTAGAVKGGKAALKVWRGGYGSYGSFDGDAALSLLLSVYDREAPGGAVAMGLVEVNFRKGKGSGKGAFIGGSTFSGAIGGIADSFFAETIAGSNNASGGNRNAGAIAGGSVEELIASAMAGNEAAMNALIKMAESGDLAAMLAMMEAAGALPSGSGQPASGGLFSRIGSFFSGLFGGNRNAGAIAGGSVEELAASAMAGNEAAMNALIKMAESGDLAAMLAMMEAAGALPSGLGQTPAGQQAAQTQAPAQTAVPGPGPQTWTRVADSPFGSDSINAIAFGANRFVAAGISGKMAYSPDGARWTAVADSTFDTNHIYSIAYGANKFVAGGTSGKMAYSSDGVRWTEVADSTFGQYNTSYDIAYGANRFVAGGGSGRMAYSPDGVTWTAVADSTFGEEDNISGIAFGNNRFVAVGDRGKMAYSRDGASWTRITDSIFDGWGISAIAWGNNRFVAVDMGGKMAYSSDGARWTAVADSTFGNNFIRTIAWSGNRFVAGGYDGKMAYSSDGVTWTAVADRSFSISHIYAIAWGNNTFVAADYIGKMAYSTGR